jgi:hypothetical protein
MMAEENQEASPQSKPAPESANSNQETAFEQAETGLDSTSEDTSAIHNQGNNDTVSNQSEAKNEQGNISSENDGGPTKDVKMAAKEALQRTAHAAEGADSTVEISEADIGNTTNDLQQEAIKAMAMKAESERIKREQAQVDASRGRFVEDMLLRLDVTDSNQPIILEVTGDLIVGRADNVTDYIPEIDLTAHGAYRLGLSRRHALIRLHEDTLLVKDLSSRNGTFVNNTMVKSGETHPLKDGDELRFGNLAVRVSFQNKN